MVPSKECLRLPEKEGLLVHCKGRLLHESLFPCNCLDYLEHTQLLHHAGSVGLERNLARGTM